MSVYCGIDEVPKGKKRGTLEECTAAGQLRYYGIKKIDAKKVAKTKAETKTKTKTKTKRRPTRNDGDEKTNAKVSYEQRNQIRIYKKLKKFSDVV